MAGRVLGTEKLFAAMLILPQEIRKTVLVGALRKGAQPIRDTAAAMAPRGPDHRDDSRHIYEVVSVAIDRKPWLANMEARVVVFVPYKGPRAAAHWRYVEFGTSLQKAQPFLRPAFDSQAPSAVRIIIREMQTGVARIVKSLNR